MEVIPHIINKYYKVQYELLDNKNEDLPEWLKKLFSDSNFDFYGLKGKEYKIVFQTVGDYLVLYKATKNVDDLPFNERSQLPLKVSELKDDMSSDSKTFVPKKEGRYEPDSEGYYKVPFMGYKVKYCELEKEKDEVTGRTTKFSRPECDNLTKEDNPNFIQFDLNNKKAYQYVQKRNVFPAHYFTGKWFYAKGDIESSKGEIHHSTSKSDFVEINPKEDFLELVDISSSVNDRNVTKKELFKVEWKEYERNCGDRNCSFDDNIKNFNSFEERENSNKNIFKR